MGGVIACPVCTSQYRIRKKITAAGARMTCPSCTYEFRFHIADLMSVDDDAAYEATVSDAAVMDVETSLSMTGLQMLDDGPVQIPDVGEVLVTYDDTEPTVQSSSEALAASMSRIPKQQETQLRPRPSDNGPPTPKVETPAISRARQLLAGNAGYVTQERYIPVTDSAAPMRWGLIGAASMLTMLLCAGIGGIVAIGTGGGTSGATAAALPPPPPVPTPAVVPVPLPPPRPAPTEVTEVPEGVLTLDEENPAGSDEARAKEPAEPEPAPRPRKARPRVTQGGSTVPKAQPPEPATPRATPPSPEVPEPEPTASASEVPDGSDLVDPWQ